MPGHEERFHFTMFLTGALFVFTPVIVALGVGVVLWWQRRSRRQQSSQE